MIPIAPKPEPAGFDGEVRIRGRTFLATNPRPTSEQFKPHQYWKWAAREVYEAYERVCAYSCMYIPSPSGSIDHFVAKSRDPSLAYEWGNFRLCLHRMNLYKSDNEEIVDPFAIAAGHFVLDFPSCLVRPGQGLSDQDALKVERTIRVLRLNEDDSLVQERCDLMVAFADGDVRLPFLQRRYPFLAAEIIRQDIEGTAAEVFRRNTI